MYICLCEPVTDRQIRQAVEDGCRTLRQVKDRLGCCNDCARCARAAKEVVDHTLAGLTTTCCTAMSSALK